MNRFLVSCAVAGLLLLGAAQASASRDHHGGKTRIEGTISALSTTSITVGNPTRSLTCDLKSPASGFTVGDKVELRCQLQGAHLVATRLEHDDEQEQQNQRVRIEGSISALSATAITVTSGLHSLTCTLTSPATGFAVGDRVELRCEQHGTSLVVTRLEKEDHNGHHARKVKIEGKITALSATSITVQSGARSATCTLASAVSGFKVGDQVEMRCKQHGTDLVVTRLKHGDHDEGKRSEREGRH